VKARIFLVITTLTSFPQTHRHLLYHLPMNPLDWLLGILLVYSIVRAAMQGFFREAFALGGLVLGFLLACWYYREGARHLTGLISAQPLAQFAAFLLILMATMIVSSLIGRMLRRTVSAVGLGFFDRLLGALFGLLRGCLLGTALLMAFTAFLPTAPWISNSKLSPYFLRAAHAVSFVMPSDLKSRLHEGVERIKHRAPDWIKSASLPHTD
jgi:membrane protein required for colicin V production